MTARVMTRRGADERFLDLLRSGWKVDVAAAQVGRTAASIAIRRKRDPKFHRLCTTARRAGLRAMRRMLAGFRPDASCFLALMFPRADYESDR
jgi:hypothetical protein